MNKDHKKNYAFIIHSLGIGGMERVMSIIIKHIATNYNVQVHLILIGIKREILQEIPNKIIVHKPKWDFDNNWRNWFTIRTILFIRKTVNEIKPASVLSFGEMWNNLVLISLYGLKIPIYISDRSRPNKNLGKIQNILRDRLYPKAAGFIAQTEKGREVAVKKKWNKNITIIGNPIPMIEGRLNRENIILNVGRLVKTKNIDQLLEIFSNLTQKSDFHNWMLSIVGGDAQKQNMSEELKKKAQELNIFDRVNFEGEQKDVQQYYLKSEIFAFTSTSEGFPNALAEAMSAGMAVIAYDCIAGPSDLIDDGINGFLIEENNKAEFAEKLNLLMSNTNLRSEFSKAARKKIELFNEKSISEQFYHFIKSC